MVTPQEIKKSKSLLALLIHPGAFPSIFEGGRAIRTTTPMSRLRGDYGMGTWEDTER